jgi:hypothetical protein
MTAGRCRACHTLTLMVPLGDGRSAYCLSCQARVDLPLPPTGAAPLLDAPAAGAEGTRR